MFIRAVAATLALSLMAREPGGPAGSHTIAGTWKCSGDAVKGDAGSAYQPKAEGLVVPDTTDRIVTSGYECSDDATELAGTGDETGVDVEGKCDTKLGYDTFHSMSLTLDDTDPNAASWSGDMTSVVDDIIHTSERFKWKGFDCSRVE